MAKVLLVDDRPENLLALEAILEPLEQELLYARSGEEALGQLLRHDAAVILLDVQMPLLDGFETARLIKERERTKHIPIIFVTAISKDEEHVYRGYSTGAVDYVFKPFNPEVLRSKVAVFIDLYEKTEQLKRQAEQLKEQELAELRRESEERYRFLAEAQPDQIWTALPSGELDYVNQRVLDYFGNTFDEQVTYGWTNGVHPDDLPRTLKLWHRALADATPLTRYAAFVQDAIARHPPAGRAVIVAHWPDDPLERLLRAEAARLVTEAPDDWRAADALLVAAFEGSREG